MRPLFCWPLDQSPDGSEGKESACNVGDLGLIPGLGRSPGEEQPPTPVFLPGEFHGQMSLAGPRPCGRKELDTAEQLSLHTDRRNFL